MQLRLRNFQAIADASLTVEGLTVVTGPSNRGKSALIRGTAATLFGLPGDHFVRRGTDWTGGAVKLPAQGNQLGDLEVMWRKVPANRRKPNLQPTLQINGVEHTKIGRDHKHLTAPHGLIELETTATRLRPQVAMQHDPIYLVGENETTAAEVFKLLGRVDVVTTAQALARTDLRGAESKRKTRAEDLTKARATADELAALPALELELDVLRKETARAEEERTRRENLRGALRELANLKPTPPPPSPALKDVTPVTEQQNLLRELVRLVRKVLPKPPDLATTPNQELLDKIRELIRLDHEQAELERLKERTEDEIGENGARLLTLQESLDVCPTCGRPFDKPPHPHDEPQL